MNQFDFLFFLFLISTFGTDISNLSYFHMSISQVGMFLVGHFLPFIDIMPYSLMSNLCMNQI